MIEDYETRSAAYALMYRLEKTKEDANLTAYLQVALSATADPDPNDQDLLCESFVSVRVLSEGPLGDMSLKDIAEACDSGDCVGFEKQIAVRSVTGKQMADLLYEAGSEPGFFGLDDDGNTVR
jgi:hypothetical protein